MSKYGRLLYSDSEHGADMLYATGVKVPDPFVWVSYLGYNYILVNRLEIDRVRREARGAEVLSSESFSSKSGKKGPEHQILAFARKLGMKRVEVPSDFPLGLAESLRKGGLLIKPQGASFFPGRAVKSEDEIELIRKALRLAETGLSRGVEILRQARVSGNRILRWKGQPLTSEILRGEIDATIIRQGGLPSGTIVAGGEQACDPHERGHGPLRSGEAIILDIFPRDQRSGYFGDLTRTVVKGQASDKLHRLYKTVKEGQSWILSRMKVGIDGDILHQGLVRRFTKSGFPTEQRDARWCGFFHGTGHSLGLEIHEPPRFSSGPFVAQTVMTVEPGLYYPGLGGVRLEDLVVIRAKGIENLTTAPFEFEV